MGNGAARFERASQVGDEPLVVYRQSFSIKLRPEMHHIPKGASYFRIARPLRFQVSHSTDFLGVNRRRIRFTDRSWNLRLVIVLRHYPYNYLSAFGITVPICFNVGRHHGIGTEGLEPSANCVSMPVQQALHY